MTHPDDPEATDTHELTPERYEALMGLGPRLGPEGDSYERRGAHQVAYGWLAFLGSYWPPGELPSADASVLFPRVQTFRHVISARS